jgi:septal ring factor EnvC (AmiA/AmiB activator)
MNSIELTLVRRANALELATPMEVDSAESDGSVTPEFAASPALEVHVPEWLRDAANALNERFAQFEGLLEKLKAKNQRVEDAFLQLVQVYRDLLSNQNALYDQAAADKEALARKTQWDYESLRVASDRFAKQVELALQAADAEKSEQFSALATEVNAQAANTQEIVDFVKNLAERSSRESAETQTRLSRLEDQLTAQAARAKKEARQIEERYRKQTAAYLQLAITRVQAAKAADAEKGLRELATSIKDGKSLDELSVREKAPVVADKVPAAPAEQPQATNSEDHASDLEDAVMEDVPIGNAGGNPPPPVGNGGNPGDDPSYSDSDSDGNAQRRDRRNLKDLSHSTTGQVVVTTVE